MKCDKCGETMDEMPWVLTSYPPKLEYRCPKCNNIKYSSSQNFDKIEFKNGEYIKCIT